MKKAEIKVGGMYLAKISGAIVTVRVDAIREDVKAGYRRGINSHKMTTVTCYDVTNLKTGRKTTFRSAAKFRSEATPQGDSRNVPTDEQMKGMAKEIARETPTPTTDTPWTQGGHKTAPHYRRTLNDRNILVAMNSAKKWMAVVEGKGIAMSHDLSGCQREAELMVRRMPPKTPAPTPAPTPAATPEQETEDEQRPDPTAPPAATGTGSAPDAGLDASILYTDAPEAYDGFGTRTIEVIGQYRGPMGWVDIRKVTVRDAHREWQAGRYASGMYMAYNEVEWVGQYMAEHLMRCGTFRLKVPESMVHPNLTQYGTEDEKVSALTEEQQKDLARASFARRMQDALEDSSPKSLRWCSQCLSVPCVCEAEQEAEQEGEQGADPTVAPTAGAGPTASSPTDMPAASAGRKDGDTPAPARGDEQRPDPTHGSSAPNADEGHSPAPAPQPSGTADISAGGAMQLAPSLGLAARIVATRLAPDTGVNLTEEQRDILSIAVAIQAARMAGQRVLVIGAGAGTGKTFTLKKLEMALQGIGQYTAFNRSLVDKSKAKFTRAACHTTHQLAYRAVGHRFGDRIRKKGPRLRSADIAARLGIEDMYIELPTYIASLDEDGKPRMRRLKAGWLAGQVLVAIGKYCQSDRPALDADMIPRPADIDGKLPDGRRDYANSDRVRAYLRPFLDKAWDDLCDPTGWLPFAQDVYVKLWQLGQGTQRPVIGADYILLDEAQDTAPVMLDVLKQQTHAMLILVGDDNQQIYEWRGAVNAMAAFRGAPRRLLSQSFRFGQIGADVANSILGTLEEPTDLVMKGNPAIPTRVCKVEEPRAYLYRTNAGTVGRLMQARKEGKRGHLIGGTDEVVKFCKAALSLQEGKGTDHPELGCFGTWKEVQEYSKEDEGADLRLMVKLIDEFKAEAILEALEDMPKEEEADLVICTAHRSKGREWASVRMGPDFPLPNRMSDSDRRLLYVACTRAQEELDITECPTFIGGYERGNGNGTEGERFIPGLEISWTVPMPTAEDLAAYRAVKAEKATPAVSPAPTPVATPAVPNRDGALYVGHRDTDEPAPAIPYTWASIDGQWCVRGPAEQQGKRVTVTRKNGSTSQETLRKTLRKSGDVWFYSTRA